MRIANWYKLHKDGEFYFLYRDRCSFVPNDHATKLSSALRKLSKSSAQGSANVKTESAEDKVCVQPAVSPVIRNVESAEKVAREEDNMPVTENAVAVANEDKVVPVCDGALSETAASLPYDIQINVQRPSPVREVSNSRRKLFSVGAGPDSKDGEQEVWPDSMPVTNTADANTGVNAETNTAATGKESTLAEVTSVISANTDRLASSALENVSSNVVTKVRPISGPATVTCAERLEYDSVRKSRSVTNSLDEEGENVGFVIRSRRSIGAISSMTQDASLGSFANSVGATAKDSIRRIYSTVSFDRQSLKSGFDAEETADLSTHSGPVPPAAQKASFYGLRSRHTSGLETPMSTLDTSSVTSIGEAGISPSRYNNCIKLTPSMPAVPNCCCSKGSAPHWSSPPFLIFDIWMLWRPVLSARVPECQKLKIVG